MADGDKKEMSPADRVALRRESAALPAFILFILSILFPSLEMLVDLFPDSEATMLKKVEAAQDVAGRLAIYQQLTERYPENPTYKAKVDSLQKLYDRQQEAKEKEAAIDKRIRALFNPVDFSMPSLVSYAKERMEDPEKFVHIKSLFGTGEPMFTVTMTYYGMDPMRKRTIRAWINMKGEVVKILQDD